MKYFVTAIGTDSGKTLVSAILCEALDADYWKPIQSGMPRDTETVEKLVSNKRSVFHPERYLLKTPVSPHAAAKIDQTEISPDALTLPATANTLVIEGAGGCMVPLNDHDLMIDLIGRFNARVILVSNHYLGSINHTLLTLEALHHRNLPISGLIFNGDRNEESERVILYRANAPCLLRIGREEAIDASVVRKYARILKANWNG